METCNICGKEVPDGSYVIIDDKPVCINCQNKTDETLLHTKLKPKDIVCPHCNENYSAELKQCPKCHNYNPMFDFPIGEYFINILVAYLTIFFVWSGFMILTKGTQYLVSVLFSPLILIGVLLNTIGAAILFYFGRWIRSFFSKK